MSRHQVYRQKCKQARTVAYTVWPELARQRWR